MKGIIAAVVLALPLAATALLPNPASADVIIRPVFRAPARTPVVVQAPRRVERRVWVAGRWDYSYQSFMRLRQIKPLR